MKILLSNNLDAPTFEKRLKIENSRMIYLIIYQEVSTHLIF